MLRLGLCCHNYYYLFLRCESQYQVSAVKIDRNAQIEEDNNNLKKGNELNIINIMVLALLN